ncbi:redoxin domain-containing protein, partial [bacterium]|nr:redoxin domain-containing protein [bacterium]
MKFSSLVLVVASLIAVAAADAEDLGVIAPFTLAGLKPNSKVVFPESQPKKLTALCFLGTECPLAKLYAGRLQKLADEFDSVRFVGINSNVQDSLTDIQRYVEATGIEFEMAKDVSNVIADKLAVTRTPEVIVCDNQRNIIYRGRVDDQYLPGVSRNAATRDDLRIAMTQALAGEKIEVSRTAPEGCLLGRVRSSTADATVTFSNQVVRVLQKNCIECHREGEIGPFSMETYEETIGWADMMLEVIEDKRMPPWHADASVGTFANARSMPKQDITILKDWVAQGTPEGDRDDLPPPFKAIDGWRLPKAPDIVVEMRKRPFRVPADGTIEYQYFVVDPEFKEDKWITAAEVIPGNRSVVHHSIVFIRPPDGERPRGVGWLAAYVPGQTPLTFESGRARFVPKGSKLVFQQHYTPNGTVADDITKIGMVFADEAEIQTELMTVIALDQSFEIQPHDDSHIVDVFTHGLPREGKLLAVSPHMHYRGKSFEAFATGADQSEQPLVKVPRYDFNWQHRYEFTEPLPLSKFRQFKGMVEFDNSVDNPFNPDPNQFVSWGDQTWEEMAIAFFDIAVPRRDSDSFANST